MHTTRTATRKATITTTTTTTTSTSIVISNPSRCCIDRGVAGHLRSDSRYNMVTFFGGSPDLWFCYVSVKPEGTAYRCPHSLPHLFVMMKYLRLGRWSAPPTARRLPRLSWAARPYWTPSGRLTSPHPDLRQARAWRRPAVVHANTCRKAANARHFPPQHIRPPVCSFATQRAVAMVCWRPHSTPGPRWPRWQD